MTIEKELLRVLVDRRHPVSKAKLAEVLQCNSRTVTRAISKLQAEGAKVEQTRRDKQVHYKLTDAGMNVAWFSSDNLRLMQLMLELQSELGLNPVAELEPLQRKLKELMRTTFGQQVPRVRPKPSARRRVDALTLRDLSRAIASAHRVRFNYEGRSAKFPEAGAGAAAQLNREVSPSAVELYRDNWYLLGWCHEREDWRYFSIERISQLELSDQLALNKTPPAAHYRGYGIFDLERLHKVELRFTRYRTEWVQDEIWHADQDDRYDEQQRLIRSFPYGKDTELLRDLMREGPDVEVLKPPELRDKLAARHAACVSASKSTSEPSKSDQRHERIAVKQVNKKPLADR